MSVSLQCPECRRINGPLATKCIWCGLPIVDLEAAGEFAPAQFELDYLDGISRLEEPVSVLMILKADGIEISESLPGSRTVHIPVGSIIEASVTDASTSGVISAKRPPLWWLTKPISTWFEPAPTRKIVSHDYILAVRYTDVEGERKALFHRESERGRSVVNEAARVIEMMIRNRDRENG